MVYLVWWLLPDSNWGHKALQASALPTELKSQDVGTYLIVNYAAKMIGRPLPYDYLRITQELKSHTRLILA